MPRRRRISRGFRTRSKNFTATPRQSKGFRPDLAIPLAYGCAFSALFQGLLTGGAKIGMKCRKIETRGGWRQKPAFFPTPRRTQIRPAGLTEYDASLRPPLPLDALGWPALADRRCPPRC